MNPKYQIYIPSKGRFKTRFTVKALERLRVPFKVVIEPSEYDAYAEFITPEKLLVLPADSFQLFNARNWIKNYSISKGESKHWQIDDNIFSFFRLNRNQQIKVTSGTIFRCAEDFTDRYENIPFAGFNYHTFAIERRSMMPFRLNTRIYSCTLVDNKFDFRWRSLYNDDTDVCLQALKAGHCTVLFNAFLQKKAVTMTTAGGNTETLYLIENGRLKMAEALRQLHPDVTKIKWKFGRWQHSVSYVPFKTNRLIFKADYIKKSGVNNFGMILKTL